MVLPVEPPNVKKFPESLDCPMDSRLHFESDLESVQVLGRTAGIFWIRYGEIRGGTNKEMKNLLFALTLLACVVGIAGATNITFDTVNSGFGCGAAVGCVDNGDGSITIGTVTLAFTVVPPSVTLTPPSNTNWGSIVPTCSVATCALTDFTGALLNIVVNETAPSSASAAFGAGMVSGSVGTNSSLAKVTWTAAGVKAGTVDATFLIPNNPLNINSIKQGETTVQGFVDVASVPEPTTFALLGAGMAALALIRRRAA